MSDRVELQSRAKAAKQAAIAGLRELFRLKGVEASDEATMLELLSDSVRTSG